MVEPIAANDDRLLPRVEPIEKPAHLLEPVAGGHPLLILILPAVGSRLEKFHVGRSEAVAAAMLVGDRASVILDDRPRAVGAELVAPGVVKLFNRTDERHIAVAHQVEEAVSG